MGRRRKRSGPGRTRRLLAVLALLVPLAACGGRDASDTAASMVPCGGAATERYAELPGVPAELTSLDVHRPAAVDGVCSDRPLVVWVHGGGWTGGDKSDHIDDKVRLFTGAGFVFASVNYRLTDPATLPPAPQFPVHDADVAAAIGWLIDHARELGTDRARVAVLGHSAGGGIVAAVATDPRFLGAHDLGLDALRCAGSIDGEGYDITAGATHPEPFVHDVYLDAFGDDPATWAEASPVRHVSAGRGIPGFFIAARGPDMRLDLHAGFAEALRSAGVPVTVVDAATLDHAEVSVDIGAPGDTVVTPPLMEFLAACFEHDRR
ncbi:alpha/beta hydrolase [Dermatobacter hominis]|uniref:alpha/beta hydrolase n=1 Tax=Dermatobacter hominis TaxID=2884263 RepID=UPI001D1065DA|nr:alpha/beta hydrolase [Dermatobacter hominis]UDY37548.1 alpha/beta hydrolase [Dermatobacter hominis]